MDAALTLARLTAEFNSQLKDRDFEGAEQLLLHGLELFPTQQAFLHFQFGQLYGRWNKLSSAIHHLRQAADLSYVAGDEILQIQALEMLKLERERQVAQQP